MATDSVSERNGKSDVFGLYSHDDDLFVVFPSDRITLVSKPSSKIDEVMLHTRNNEDINIEIMLKKSKLGVLPVTGSCSLGGHPVLAGKPRKAKEGDVLEIGGTMFTFTTKNNIEHLSGTKKSRQLPMIPNKDTEEMDEDSVFINSLSGNDEELRKLFKDINRTISKLKKTPLKDLTLKRPYTVMVVHAIGYQLFLQPSAATGVQTVQELRFALWKYESVNQQHLKEFLSLYHEALLTSATPSLKLPGDIPVINFLYQILSECTTNKNLIDDMTQISCIVMCALESLCKTEQNKMAALSSDGITQVLESMKLPRLKDNSNFLTNCWDVLTNLLSVTHKEDGDFGMNQDQVQSLVQLIERQSELKLEDKVVKATLNCLIAAANAAKTHVRRSSDTELRHSSQNSSTSRKASEMLSILQRSLDSLRECATKIDPAVNSLYFSAVKLLAPLSPIPKKPPRKGLYERSPSGKVKLKPNLSEGDIGSPRLRLSPKYRRLPTQPTLKEEPGGPGPPEWSPEPPARRRHRDGESLKSCTLNSSTKDSLAGDKEERSHTMPVTRETPSIAVHFQNDQFEPTPDHTTVQLLSDGQSKDQSDSQPKDQSDSQPKDQSDSQPKDQSDSRPKDQSDSRPKDQSDSRPKDQSDSRPKDQSDSQPKDQSDSWPKDQSDSRPKDQSDSQPKDQSDSRPKDQSDSRPKDQSDSWPKDQSDSRPKDQSDSRPKDQSDNQMIKSVNPAAKHTTRLPRKDDMSVRSIFDSLLKCSPQQSVIKVPQVNKESRYYPSLRRESRNVEEFKKMMRENQSESDEEEKEEEEEEGEEEEKEEEEGEEEKVEKEEATTSKKDPDAPFLHNNRPVGDGSEAVSMATCPPQEQSLGKQQSSWTPVSSSELFAFQEERDIVVSPDQTALEELQAGHRDIEDVLQQRVEILPQVCTLWYDDQGCKAVINVVQVCFGDNEGDLIQDRTLFFDALKVFHEIRGSWRLSACALVLKYLKEILCTSNDKRQGSAACNILLTICERFTELILSCKRKSSSRSLLALSDRENKEMCYSYLHEIWKIIVSRLTEENINPEIKENFLQLKPKLQVFSKP